MLQAYLLGDDSKHKVKILMSVGGVVELFHTRSDVEGRFTFAGVPPGEYVIQSGAPGMLRVIVIGSGGYLDLDMGTKQREGFVTIRLEAGATLDLGKVIVKQK